MLIIFDVHGKISLYHNIIKKNKGQNSVQLGDFGFKKEHDWFLNNIDYNKNKILFGNHDYYPYLNKEHSLGDYDYDPYKKIMFIRGAKSIDAHLRTIGKDYFQNEEISYKKFFEVYDYYTTVKPEIVVSHTGPKNILKHIFNFGDTEKDKSLTTEVFQQMFDEHKPLLWIFGHHHKNIDEKIENTRFICSDELNTFVI